MKKNLCVLFGGVSSEHDVSLLSATSVLENLDKEKYNIIMLGITKEGKWLEYKGDIKNLKDGSWVKNTISANIVPCRDVHGLQYADGSTKHLDVIFPVLHGKNGEDGTVQGLFELAGIPYVGCKVLGSAVCMDKIVANQLMDANNIPRCEWDFLEKRDANLLEEKEKELAQTLKYPIFVKPANAGSSVGISKAENKEELFAAATLAFMHDSRILFERFVDGQEVECAVWGNDIVQSTLPGEILASDSFYTYDDKYINGTSTTALPAHLPQEKLVEVQQCAINAYKALCCKGLSRVDFFVEKSTGKILLNEINTLPGFTSISMYPKMMMNTGLSYSELLDELILLALENIYE